MSNLKPHLSMRPVDPAGTKARRWTCTYEGCTEAGDINILIKQDCIEPPPPPCHWCGQTPLCAPDCAGIELALSGDDVHVVGEQPAWQPLDALSEENNDD